MATELAKAYVQIVPSAEGMEGAISGVMNGEATAAGKSGGENFASSFGSIAKKAITALGIGKLIKDGISSASEFETAMAKTSTLFTGSAEEFAGLQQRILNISSATGMAATTLAEAAYSAESASVPMELLGDMIESSAKLANAGFTDVDTALSATAKTMNAYGMSGAEAMEQVQKVLIQTQNYGITTVGELGASLANVTPTAAAMGVSFEQVGASMALMTARGVPTAQATTQLRAAMTELGKSGTKASEAFGKAAKGTKYAGKSFQQAIASGATLGEVFSMMQNYADKSGLSMVDLWGSVEAGNAAMMIAADMETFNKDLEEMNTGADVVGDGYGKMANTFGKSMQRLKESAKNFMITLFEGGDISASFDAMLESLGDVGGKLKEWLTTGLKTLGENLPEMMSSLVDFGAGIVTSLAEVDWIELGTTILNGIIGALGTLGEKLIGLVGGAITAVSTGEIDFGSIGTAIWNGVTSVITTAGDWLSKLFTTASTVAAEVDFTGIGSQILAGVKAYIDGAGTFLSALFGSGETAAEGVDFTGIGSSILSGVTSAIDSAGTFLSSLFETGKAESEGLSWETLGTAIETGVNLILNGGEFLSSAFSAGADLISGMDWGAIGSAISDGVTGLIDAGGVFLSTCFEAGSTLIQGMDWGAIGTAISDGVIGVIDAGGTFLSTCFEAGSTLVQGIDWGAVGTAISDGVTGVIDAGGVFLSTCFEAGSTLIQGMDWGAIGSTISDGVTGVIDAGGVFLSSCFEAGSTLIQGMDWGAIGTSISSGLTGTIDAAGEFLAAPFRAAKSLIEGIDWASVGNTISSGLGEVWGGITGFIGGTLSGAGDAVSGIGSGIGAAASAAGEGLANLIRGGDGLDKQIESLKTNMTELKKAVETGKTDAEAAAKGISKAIKEGLQSELGVETMKSIGSDAVGGLVSGVESGDFAGTMTGIASGGVSAFSGAGWYGIGVNMITGIISGISATSGALYSRLRTVAMSALQAAKRALDVGSPSRVMRDEVGQWIPAGIAEGIDSGAGMVTDAMERMANMSLATDLAGQLAAQGQRVDAAAGSSAAEGFNLNELRSGIVEAVRTGLQNASIPVYMDGQRVSEEVDRYLGLGIAARRFAT